MAPADPARSYTYNVSSNGAAGDWSGKSSIAGDHRARPGRDGGASSRGRPQSRRLPRRPAAGKSAALSGRPMGILALYSGSLGDVLGDTATRRFWCSCPMTKILSEEFIAVGIQAAHERR
jgi:hypothetical protein